MHLNFQKVCNFLLQFRKKYFAKKMPERVRIFYLPSTSPANARLRLEDLAERWQVILQFLA